MSAVFHGPGALAIARFAAGDRELVG